MNAIEELVDFVSLIEDRCGISYKKNDVAHLKSAIEKRMLNNGIYDLSVYYNHVFNDHDEFSHLIEILTINETYFFREVNQIDFLCEKLIPPMLQNSENSIRILSVGCSDGSEVYSIVMKLIERFGDLAMDRIDVMGADIDRKILMKAQNGLYGKNSFRTDDETYKNEFFNKKGLIYELSDRVKNRVKFFQANLLSDQYPDEIKKVDFIFYRNVSIYFENHNQRRVFQNLSNLLNKDGCIFLSSTETHQHHRMNILNICEDEGLFYFKKGDALIKEKQYTFEEIESVKQEETTSGSIISFDDIKRRVKEREEALKEELQLVVEITDTPDITDIVEYAKDKDYSSAMEKLDVLLKKEPDCIDALTLKASILLNLNKINEARSIIAKVISINNLNIEVIILLGIIEKYDVKIQESIKHFKSAMFLDPTVWFVHYNLAELYKLSGKNREAVREYTLSKKLLLTHGLKNTGLTFFPFSFKSEQLIKLFDNNIDLLSNEGASLERRWVNSGSGI
ncbi:MAG: methyltransferase domain-containing protein [Nitrospinae bacterium]|nr:methyltransferase domain-containing protein [Nitrospinota bacterium]